MSHRSGSGQVEVVCTVGEVLLSRATGAVLVQDVHAETVEPDGDVPQTAARTSNTWTSHSPVVATARRPTSLKAA